MRVLLVKSKLAGLIIKIHMQDDEIDHVYDIKSALEKLKGNHMTSS